MDLTKYYTEILKNKILSKEEEVELFKEFHLETTSDKRKEQIRNRIINANLRFAFNQAKRFSKNDPSMFGELIAAANEGLIVGFDKFDHLGGVRFLSYAGWWVNQRILNEMSKMRIVSLPIWKQQLATKIQKILDANEKMTLKQLIAKLEELEVKFKDKDVEELYQTRYLTFYIDDIDENEFEIDPIGEELNQKLDDEKIWKLVNNLPSPHREVIARCFGLDDAAEHSVAQIAKSLKVKKEEVKRIRLEGLAMLKKEMSSTG